MRKEKADLEADREILRKAAAYFARETKPTVVSDHAGEFPVLRLCQLGEVPRSTFYASHNRLSPRDRDDAVRANEVIDVHVASRRTYGAPRVLGQLRHAGRRH